MSEEPELANSHFSDHPKFIRPDVRMERKQPSGVTHVYFDDVEVDFLILRDSITVRRSGAVNILTMSIIVGSVDMDSSVQGSE